MPHSGRLRTWTDDRGFGFIAPKDGGRELFVHISAFPRDGSRPTIGESLTYELGTGKDGKPQAVRVYRQAIGRPAEYPKRHGRNNSRKSPVVAVITFLLVAGLAAYVYKTFQQRSARQLPLDMDAPATTSATPKQAGVSFRCDGRTHCSQMTSCAEAQFFLKNCPDTKMDGNNDGVPCEQQWCTGPFAK